jgi:hypothetical protein
MRKRKGERGKPWHNPQEALKDLEGEPFISTTKDVELMHPIIQFTTSRDIPI